jgi:parallel beta-helix repeat protein
MALTPRLLSPAGRVRRPTVRPRVEALESRDVPSTLLEVRPGDPSAFQTIQSAVNAARPGDRIEVFSGTYDEAVNISTPGLILFGAPGASVVIENPGGAMNGITVQAASGAKLAGFTLANVTVRGFAGDGVSLDNVSGFTLSHVTAQGNGDYGLFPVLSANGVIIACAASGSNDTGIYVGQSSHVVVRNSVAFDNVNGIEIENCTGVQAVGNRVFGNTVGILEDLLPGLTVETAVGNVIRGNVVTANNRPNTAPPGDPAALEPPGTGIAIVGGTGTLVQGNTVTGNAFAGIAVLSGADLLGPYPAGLDPNPENTLVEGNVALGNGFLTQVPPGFPQPADLLWDGNGRNNHWRSNVFGTSTPGKLP